MLGADRPARLAGGLRSARMLFLLAACTLVLATPSAARADKTPERSRPVEIATDDNAPAPADLPMVQDREREYFYLPEAWLRSRWRAEPPSRAYIALLAPHAQDTEEDFAPCTRVVDPLREFPLAGTESVIGELALDSHRPRGCFAILAPSLRLRPL